MPDHSSYISGFKNQVLTPASPPPALFNDPSPQIEAGWKVYQNNVFLSLVTALKETYPVVHTLVGEGFFGAMAKIFVEGNPPKGPVVAEYGEAFPAFIEQFEPAQSLPYLADIARLEWAWITAYHGPDAMALEPAEFNAVDPDDIASTRLDIHPTVQFIVSRHPIATIWSAHQSDDVPQIDLSLGGEIAMVARPQLDAIVSVVTKGDHSFLSALQRGWAIGPAYEIAEDVDPLFDLQSALVSLIGSGLITGYRSTN